MIDTSSSKVGRFGRRSKGLRNSTLPIGEADANIFNCPTCARPLGVGVRRCPGCGTRLIAGVKATRAIGFMAMGLVAGIMVGSALMAIATFGNRSTPAGVVAQPSNVTPTQLPIASAAVTPVDPAIPTSAVSALRQSVVLNQRVLADAARLRAALDTTHPSGNQIATVLRSLASTAAFGQGVALGVAEWSDGASVSAGLVAFYATVGTIASDGLSASIGNPTAYVTAAKHMLTAAAGIADLDAASRVLAASANLSLPPLAPSAAGTAP